MTLPTAQVHHFYKIWFPLLDFVNDQRKVVDVLFKKGSVDANHAIQVRNLLWKEEALLDRFITENPAQLSPEDLQIAQTWKHRRQGTFIIYKALKKHAILISQENKADVFAVKGLVSSLDEIFGPSIPIMIEGVLLPFYDEIVTDGLFQMYSVSFGPGIRANLKDIYDDAKERGAIITTLLPNQVSPSLESLAAKAEATNAKVLDAFLRYQYKSGLSPKTVERDTTNVSTAARYWLHQQSEPLSLREIGRDALRNYLASLSEQERKAARMSLKRFISFLRDTARLGWDEAERILEELKR